MLSKSRACGISPYTTKEYKGHAWILDFWFALIAVSVTCNLVSIMFIREPDLNIMAASTVVIQQQPKAVPMVTAWSSGLCHCCQDMNSCEWKPLNTSLLKTPFWSVITDHAALERKLSYWLRGVAKKPSALESWNCAPSIKVCGLPKTWHWAHISKCGRFWEFVRQAGLWVHIWECGRVWAYIWKYRCVLVHTRKSSRVMEVTHEDIYLKDISFCCHKWKCGCVFKFIFRNVDTALNPYIGPSGHERVGCISCPPVSIQPHCKKKKNPS